MLPFKDTTAALDEPKNARMEQRTQAHVKAQIREAAALLGVDETTFITSVAYERARQTIDEHQRTLLIAEDVEAFTSALERDAEPPESLKAIANAHTKSVRRGA